MLMPVPSFSYNRKRLKGSKGPEDCLMALACLFNVLLDVCKVRSSTLLAYAAQSSHEV